MMLSLLHFFFLSCSGIVKRSHLINFFKISIQVGKGVELKMDVVSSVLTFFLKGGPAPSLWPCGTSQTRDQTCVPCTGSAES